MPALREYLLQNDYSAGIIRSVARHLIPEDGAWDIVNGLIDEDGSAYRRGGVIAISDALPGGGAGRFLWEGYMIPGRRTLLASPDDFFVLGDDGQTLITLGSDGLTYPHRSAYLKGLLFIGGGFIYGGSRKTASYSAGTASITNGDTTLTGSGTSFLANVDPGMLLQFGNERVYCVASVESDTSLTLSEPYEGANKSNAAYTLWNIYKITPADPYEPSESYEVVDNRLVWFAGSRVRFSEINRPHDVTNQFDAANEHELPFGVEVIGLAATGGILLIFTTSGIWALQGMAYDIVDDAGNPQHRLEPISRELVLYGAAGIVAWEQALIVPCLSGIYILDGISEPVLISQNLDSLYERFHDGSHRPGQAVVYQSHYLLPIMATSGEVIQILVCRLRPQAGDRRRQRVFSWTRFVGGRGGKISAFSVRTSTGAAEEQLLGVEGVASGRIVNCTPYFEPSAETKADDGETDLAHALEIISRDFPTGAETLNMVVAARIRYELVDAGSDDPVVDVAWGDGSTLKGGTWGQDSWGQMTWTSSAEAFFSVATLPESDGRHPGRARIGKRRRFIRIRTRNTGPAASYIHRSIELAIRPSPSVRR